MPLTGCCISITAISHVRKHAHGDRILTMTLVFARCASRTACNEENITLQWTAQLNQVSDAMYHVVSKVGPLEPKSTTTRDAEMGCRVTGSHVQAVFNTSCHRHWAPQRMFAATMNADAATLPALAWLCCSHMHINNNKHCEQPCRKMQNSSMP